MHLHRAMGPYSHNTLRDRVIKSISQMSMVEIELSLEMNLVPDTDVRVVGHKIMSVLSMPLRKESSRVKGLKQGFQKL